jgi:hypothetical protein
MRLQMKNFVWKHIVAVAIVGGMAFEAHATPLEIYPEVGACGSAVCLAVSGTETDTPDILQAVNDYLTGLGYSLTEVYKHDKDENEETGGASDWYETTYDNPLLTDSDATITWDGPGFIDSATVYALVKDGKADPAWYLFNISGWDGKTTLNFYNFWPDKSDEGNAISHVSLFAGAVSVSESGSIVTLLGMSLIALALARRFLA